ncbi:LysR family transcriptional regulator [Pseudonocardia acidicola]|uniref:LysR family transcriptional regulator n=1 Tax=Pseudonocardia acidicola TaxID=2724939 RepID=A0ABX1SL88_9PSEU|nr:LysR family transcriptional regulator [Pseudonocardia acidicola]NMI01745.1 LysR family transcriptional regulator [Pseudonocardia acidicola]
MTAERTVELRHLRAFVAVAEERSFTRAAERLQITQPALSRTIAALERLVGAGLIWRNRRTVQLTAAGVRFLPHAHRALAVVEEAVGVAGGEVPALRVGFTWGSTAEYTAPIVRAFEQDNPGVVVDIRRYDDTVAGLADGRTHVGFLPGDPDDPRLGTLVLAEEPRVAALPADHPLAGRDEVMLRDLENEIVVINVVSGTTSLDLWDTGRRPGTVVRVRNVDEWMEAIAAGRGIGLTPASTGRLYSHPAIRYRLIADAPLVPITLAWPRTAPHPLVADFVAVAGRTRPQSRD